MEEKKSAFVTEVAKEILRMKNCYPEDVFVSKIGKASRVGFEACRSKVLQIIEEIDESWDKGIKERESS